MNKYNINDTADVTFVNKNTGEEEFKGSVTVATIDSIERRSKKKLPLSFGFDNTPGNKNIYSNLLTQVGKEVNFESSLINGLFKVSLEGETVVFTEVIED